MCGETELDLQSLPIWEDVCSNISVSTGQVGVSLALGAGEEAGPAPGIPALATSLTLTLAHLKS